MFAPLTFSVQASRTIRITSASVPPALLAYAYFTATATAVDIRFSTPTDHGDGRHTCRANELASAGCPELSGSTPFACEELLQFPPGRVWAPAACTWLSRRTLRVVLPPDSTVTAGDVVSLRGSSIQSEHGKASSTPTFSATQHTTLLQPLVALLPSPVVTGPSAIGSCDGLQLDTSLSGGSGGRPFAAVAWAVTSSAGAADAAAVAASAMAAVDAGGSGSGSWSGALSLNNTALRHGAVYTFTLTLTNFLGHAADAAPFAVTVFGIPLPTLSIPGAPSLTVLLSESLVRFAQATPAACRVSVTNSTLRYRWEIHGTPGTAAAAVVIPTMTWNIAKDPRTLILPPAFVRANLRVGGVYTITASVQDNAGSVNNASCTVAVVASPLEASVAGGDRAIGTTDALSLDGSASLDPDADWNNTDLRFSWRTSN
jgi:hypothetical protein